VLDLVGRVDLLVGARVVVEFDRAVKYGGAEWRAALIAEKRREDALRVLGFGGARHAGGVRKGTRHTPAGCRAATGGWPPHRPRRRRRAPQVRRRGDDVQFGRSYEEFEVGATYRHWPGKTVTEYDDHLFCLLTMNHHPLHLDAHYAGESTQFGKNVVVGNHVYSLLLGMSVPDVSGKAIANLEVESLRHVAPTFHGDTLYGETTVLDKWESTSKDDRGVVHVETIGYNQDGTVVCIFRRKVMVPKESYLQARGGAEPGRPTPVPDENWPGTASTT
jgi:acyl dehydratase